MATNKRKESAALFELIGKSTLKIPKNAAALKIPEWWSSKTNPPPTPKATTLTPTEKELPTEPTPAQPRLFEPPPANTPSTLSPSIRPPSPATKTTPTPATTTTPPTPTPTSTTPKTDRPTPSTTRIFAPQTMEQHGISRRQYTPKNISSDYRRNGRIPLWVIIAAIALLLLIILTILLSLYSWSKSRNIPASTHTPPSNFTLPQPTHTLFPRPSNTTPQPLLPPPNNTTVIPENPSTKGTVYAPGTVQRSPDLFYVIIAQTPTASVAKKDADFLADHGIDVSIETSPSPSGKVIWFRIVSVQGFPTLVTADPYRKKIVLIGHLSDDFKKGKKMWDDAFLARVKPAAPQ